MHGLILEKVCVIFIRFLIGYSYEDGISIYEGIEMNCMERVWECYGDIKLWRRGKENKDAKGSVEFG